MFKKIAMAAAMAVSTMAAGPTYAGTETTFDYDPACLLIAGCFHDGQGWVCSNPQIFMFCLDGPT